MNKWIIKYELSEFYCFLNVRSKRDDVEYFFVIYMNL